MRGRGDQLGLRNVEQEVKRPVVVGEAGARAVNEAYVKTILLLCICNVRAIWFCIM